MSYHDYGNYKTKWSTTTKQAEETDNPRIQVISPQKKLFDIEQLLKKLPEEAMTVVELQEAIQKILDGR